MAIQGSQTTSTGAGTDAANAVPNGSSFLGSVEAGIEAPFNLVAGVGQAGVTAADNLAAAVNKEAATASTVQIILGVGAALALIVFVIFW